MPWIVNTATVKHGGVYHPPGSTLDVSAEDKAVLVPRFGREATEEEAAAKLPPLGELSAVEDGTPPAPLAEPAADDATTVESRVVDVRDALDLLDEADFVDGKPPPAKLAEVLGYEATAAEIDAAIALRDAG